MAVQRKGRLGRQVGWILILMVLGLLRAEKGVAELKGVPVSPSRLLRLERSSVERWRVAFLGFEAELQTAMVLLDRNGPLVAFPGFHSYLKKIVDAVESAFP